MKCNEVMELISVCSESELTQQEKSLIDSHLAQCEVCRHEVEVLHALQRKLRTGFQGTEIYAPDMIGAVMASLPRKKLVRKSALLWRWAAVGACAAMTFAACFCLLPRPTASVTKPTVALPMETAIRTEQKPAVKTVVKPAAQTTQEVEKPEPKDIAIARKPRAARTTAAEVPKARPQKSIKPSYTPSPEDLAELNTPCVQYTLPGVDATRADDLLAMRNQAGLGGATEERRYIHEEN